MPIHAFVGLALFLERVLHFEQIGEVRSRLDANVQLHRLGAVVQDRNVLAKSVVD